MATHATCKNPNAKRGRPSVNDTSKLKSSTITVCLTPDCKKKLVKLSSKHNQKPAAMARILIEAGVAV